MYIRNTPENVHPKQKVHKLQQMYILYEDVPVAELAYAAITPMPGDSYCRGFWYLLLCLCHVFQALINSLTTRSCTILGLTETPTRSCTILGLTETPTRSLMIHGWTETPTRSSMIKDRNTYQKLDDQGQKTYQKLDDQGQKHLPEVVQSRD